MNEPVTSAAGVTRVAVNLRGVPAGFPVRGMALVEAGRWTLTRLIDVRLSLRGPEVTLPPEITLHIGSARTQARIRPLGTPAVTRLMLRDPLPLHVGDRVLLRDPGSAALMILGATVLDVDPPALARRGAATAAGRELASWPDPPSAADLLRRHGLLRAAALAAMGVPGGMAPVAGDWLADPDRWAALRRRLAEVVAAHAKRDPLAIGMPPEAARAALGLPDRALVEALAHGQIRLEDGYLRPAGPPADRDPVTGDRAASLPPRIAAAVRAVLADLADAPFLAPDAGRLRELGLDPRAIAAAARAGLLLRVAEQVVLAPGAQVQATQILAGLPQPFTTAEARQALGTTRRVAIPLLEYLDRSGITQRLPDDRRRLRLLHGPHARGAGQLAEAHGGQEGPVVVIGEPAGIGALQPGVVEQAAHPGQAEPGGGLPEQPGSHPAAAVAGRDMQVADVSPAAVPGQPLSLIQDLRLDVADHLLAEHRGLAAAVDPDRTPHRQPVHRRIRVPARTGQVLDRSQVDDLGVPGVGEPGPPVERGDVRPLLRDPVHAGHRQFPLGVPARHAPAAEYTGARRYQCLRRPGHVRPVRVAGRGRRPVEQPADLAGVAVRGPGPVIGVVPEQVRGGGDPAALLGDQGDALAHPGVHDELPGLAFQRAQHGVHRHAHARHHRLGVGVDEPGELIAIAATERAYLDI